MAYFPIKCVQHLLSKGKLYLCKLCNNWTNLRNQHESLGGRGKTGYATFSWINATSILVWVGEEAEVRGVSRRNEKKWIISGWSERKRQGEHPLQGKEMKYRGRLAGQRWILLRKEDKDVSEDVILSTVLIWKRKGGGIIKVKEWIVNSRIIRSSFPSMWNRGEDKTKRNTGWRVRGNECNTRPQKLKFKRILEEVVT